MVYLQLLLIVLLFFLPPIDTDLGWHLRYGEYFLQTEKILKENEFTYFLADYQWVNPFVLYEIFVAVVYKFGGLVGLSLTYAGVMATTFWVYTRIAPKLPLTNLLTFLIITGTSWHVFSLGIRAQIFSLLGIIILFLVVSKSAKAHLTSRNAIADDLVKFRLPLVFLFPLPLLFVWANTHGGFALGLALLGLAAFGEIIKKRWESAFFLGLATAASGLAALVNPYGAGIYKEALHHAQYPLDQLIAEWVPPSLETKVLVAATVLLVTLLVINSNNKQKFFWISAGILFAILTFKARRFMPYFGIASALAIITSYEDRLLKIEQSLQKYAVLLLGVGSLVLFLWIVPRTLKINTNWKEYCIANQVKQPCRAVEFVRSNPIRGQNLFAAYEWGGFLEWRLPEYKYFVDGRMPAWDTPEGKSPYTVYLEIIQAQPGYQERLDEYGTDWLLIGAGTFLDIELRTKDLGQRWKEIYRDNTAVIYAR